MNHASIDIKIAESAEILRSTRMFVHWATYMYMSLLVVSSEIFKRKREANPECSDKFEIDVNKTNKSLYERMALQI